MVELDELLLALSYVNSAIAFSWSLVADSVAWSGYHSFAVLRLGNADGDVPTVDEVEPGVGGVLGVGGAVDAVVDGTGWSENFN